MLFTMYVMFGGGNDSEYMLNVFKEAEVDFKVAIHKLWKDFNTMHMIPSMHLSIAMQMELCQKLLMLDLAQLVNEGKNSLK